ncbi:MAG: stage II sporulation protein M [Candidatus Aenigmatarchaeota archaeon]
MVLESLIDPCSIKRHPMEAAIQGMVGAAVAIAICHFLGQGGLFLTFLITLAILPGIINMLKDEEEREEDGHFWRYCYSGGFLHRHGALILDYTFIIIGVAVTIASAFIVLPEETTSVLFSEQMSTISQITGNATAQDVFSKIFLNNLGVMAICFAFSLFYSSGAIFLISWNASVLGVVVGQGAKALVGMQSIPVVLLSYLPHGSFEFLGYILAGIAGGILSVAISRHTESREHFKFVFMDSLLLMALAVLMLWIGTVVEVAYIA